MVLNPDLESQSECSLHKIQVIGFSGDGGSYFKYPASFVVPINCEAVLDILFWYNNS